MKAEYCKGIIYINANPTLTDVELVKKTARILIKRYSFQSGAYEENELEYYETLCSDMTIKEMQEHYKMAKEEAQKNIENNEPLQKEKEVIKQKINALKIQCINEEMPQNENAYKSAIKQIEICLEAIKEPKNGGAKTIINDKIETLKKQLINNEIKTNEPIYLFTIKQLKQVRDRLGY